MGIQRLVLSAPIPTTGGADTPARLVSILIQRIAKRDEIPFLHVRKENVDAIRVYEKLGFKTRRNINIAVVKNNHSTQLS